MLVVKLKMSTETRLAVSTAGLNRADVTPGYHSLPIPSGSTRLKSSKIHNQTNGSVNEDEDKSFDQNSISQQKDTFANGVLSPPNFKGKRRQAIAPRKAPRKKLTDEQKRFNHINSEQKRRTAIREGYEDLCELVPSLNGRSFSRSAMIIMAAEWLGQLLEGNKILAAQLGR